VAATGDSEIARVRTFARVMDDYYLDPILGFLLPGVGDLVGSLFGVYIVLVAARRRVSPVVIARMVMNLALDAATGVVPIVGDAIDVAFKANKKNLALLVERDRTGGRATPRDWAILAGAVLLLVAVVTLIALAIAWLVHKIF
jgi:hypothetical protein